MNVHNFVFASIYSEFKLELYMYVSLCVCVHVLREKDIWTTLRCGVRKKLSWKPCFEHSSDFKVNVLAPG